MKTLLASFRPSAGSKNLLAAFIRLMCITSVAGSGLAAGAVFTYFPISDGGVYSETGVDIGGYLLADFSYKGDMHFQAFNLPAGSSVALSLGIYALPMHGKNVQIYAFDTPDAVISGADYNRGNLLGTLVLPDSYANFGQTITFDVTSFVTSASGPYWGFVLVSDGLDNFNSLTYHYGQPEALIVTVVPEPSALCLLVFAICLSAARRCSNRFHGNHRTPSIIYCSECADYALVSFRRDERRIAECQR